MRENTLPDFALSLEPGRGPTPYCASSAAISLALPPRVARKSACQTSAHAADASPLSPDTPTRPYNPSSDLLDSTRDLTLLTKSEPRNYGIAYLWLLQNRP